MLVAARREALSTQTISVKEIELPFVAFASENHGFT
jgi:hypothetical protein